MPNLIRWFAGWLAEAKDVRERLAQLEEAFKGTGTAAEKTAVE